MVERWFLLLLPLAVAVSRVSAQESPLGRHCHRPDAPGVTALSLPALHGLFPLELGLHPWQVAVVRELPENKTRSVDGSIILDPYASVREEYRRALQFHGQSAVYTGYKVPGGIGADLGIFLLSPDSIPRSSVDSTLFNVTALIDSTAGTMQIAIGYADRPKAVLYVISNSHGGLAGFWFGSPSEYDERPRGYFCASAAQ